MDHNGKVVESNPENGGNQQSLSRKSSKEIESNSIREVDELVGNLDRVDLFHNNKEINGLMEETVNEVNIPSINNTTMVTRNKRLSTWKRSVRSNTSHTAEGGLSNNACNRKRGMNDTKEDSRKKLRGTTKVDISEQNQSKAEVGKNQPCHTL